MQRKQNFSDSTIQNINIDNLLYLCYGCKKTSLKVSFYLIKIFNLGLTVLSNWNQNNYYDYLIIHIFNTFFITTLHHQITRALLLMIIGFGSDEW